MSPTAKSASTAHSATHSTPVELAKPVDPIVTNTAVDSETTGTPAETPVPKQRLVFPLALTVIAVLPIAFGIGAARLKASASSVQTVSTASESETDTDEPAPTSNPTDRRLGDRHFLERRYEVALQIYRSLGSSEPNRLPAELLYRIALCQEALGLWDDSLASQRMVSDVSESSVLRSAACFGQARVWFRLNEPSKAEALLHSMEFHEIPPSSVSTSLSREIGFLIPLALAQETVANGGHGGTFPFGDLMTWPLEAALSWADDLSGTDRPVMDNDAMNVDQVPTSLMNSLSVRRPPSNAKISDPIEEVVVDIHCQQQTIREILTKLADECGWSLDWSDLNEDVAIERVVSIRASDRPVASLLTNICSELQSTWSIEEARLTITRLDPDGTRSRRMIFRTLASLSATYPNHRLASHARFAQGQIAQCDADLILAASLFSNLAGRDTSPLATRAAYNAAMNYYWLGDFARASTQLGYVVNGAPENALHAESMIMLGRLLLDRGEPQDAVFQLRRATESRGNPREKARAAVLLGMAFLIQDKYQEAAEAVLAQRLLFDEPDVRNAAAFVTAFARWHAISNEMKEHEATFLYRAILTMKSDSDWLGQCGQLLIGRAFVELGFDDHMYDLYTQMLTIGVTEFVEAEIIYSLAIYERANGRVDVAKTQWEILDARDFNRWTNLARLRLAEVALAEGRAKNCLEICEQIHVADGITRSEIQKLMGQAFEQLGEDTLAARCYAGQFITH